MPLVTEVSTPSSRIPGSIYSFGTIQPHAESHGSRMAVLPKIKIHVETAIGIPVVDGPGVVEQTRLPAEPQRC